jgi:hypothetical protein
MRFTQLIKFFACAFVIAALSIITACSKDSDPGVLLSKCDYSPYSIGSKFVYTTNTSALSTDTITGDTSVNGVRYAKVQSTGVGSLGTPSTSTSFVRCDASGIYSLIDKGQLGGASVSNFTPKEIQSLKFPASVGLSWQTDTIKYTVVQSGQTTNVAILYKLKETAIGGSKAANGTTYSNNLITVQLKAYATYSIAGFSFVDSSIVTSSIYDKTVGLVEGTQNGTVAKLLKTATIK